MNADSRISVRFFRSQLSDLTNAFASSTTIDFSCVTANAGLLSLTSIPARSSFFRVASFSASPPRRAGFSITWTLTPRWCAAMTASSKSGSENRNILIRRDYAAAAIESRIGRAVSSGITISERDMSSSFLLVGGRRAAGLVAVQLGLDAPARDELVVRALFGHHAG